MYPAQPTPFGGGPAWQPQPYGPPPQRPPPARTPWLGILGGLFVLLVVLGGLVGGSIVLLGRTSATSAVWSDGDSPVPVSNTDPTWGDRTAPITLVVFGDLQDPFCAKLQPTIESLETMYGPATLRVVWKNAPQTFHAQSHDAAEAAMGVLALKGSPAFWHFQQRAFAGQSSLNRSSFEAWALESKVDMRKFRHGLSAHTWKAKVDEDSTTAATLGIATTPTSYVNGIRLNGVEAISEFQHVIDDELPKVRLRLSSGSRGDRIYVERSKDNFGTSWPPPAPSVLGTATAPVPTSSSTSIYVPPTASPIPHKVPIGSSPVLGNSDALVTIVEFGDFQCPFCQRAEATLAALRAEYGGKLRIVWKNNPLPFHVHAAPAAELALEARDERGDAAFWRVHDALYAGGTMRSLEQADLLRIARATGVNEAKAATAIASAKYQTTIDADVALARKVDALGTPTFFINGRKLGGAQPQSAFEAVIDVELKAAQDRVAHGTRADRVYDTIMSEATD